MAPFVNEFDTNIYPKESATFSTAPDRDGSNATLDDLTGLPSDTSQTGTDGDSDAFGRRRPSSGEHR